MTMLATPADFEAHPSGPRFRAPRLAEHSVGVLQDLGYDADRIGELVAGGAVFTEETARPPD
jgi:crotonobetainyl-CoA:carnitine CoA-transferase CaiB-like acyl-CoA transferase